MMITTGVPQSDMSVEVELIYSGCFNGEKPARNIEIAVLISFSVELGARKLDVLVLGCASTVALDRKNWYYVCRLLVCHHQCLNQLALCILLKNKRNQLSKYTVLK